ncbi:hypothetical protein QUF80_22390 [Desulfococcaceae bacterium HSG8]|nr:hypothetical protein [Desulfococcaceae bacterium HSG8]
MERDMIKLRYSKTCKISRITHHALRITFHVSRFTFQGEKL